MDKKGMRITLCVLGLGGLFFLYNYEKQVEPNLIINEICTNNFSNYSDEYGNYYNWIEIYNPTAEKISLTGYQITDSSRKNKFTFGNSVLEAGDYLTLFFTEELMQNEVGTLYTGYEIKDEAQLFLLDEKKNVIDYVKTPLLEANEVYARINNGEWQIQASTPLESNDGQEKIFRTSLISTMNPIFSKASGFYDEPFEITISLQGGVEADIYYTIDGSTPTRESAKYEKPIYINDASNNPNVYAMNTDITVQGKSEAGGVVVPPRQLIDKATVVRAVAYNKAGEVSEVTTATYFIGFGDKLEYTNMEVVSLIMDPADLFDYDVGIYVAGRISDGIQLSDLWVSQNANFGKRGKSAEREAHMDYFDKNHELSLFMNCGIRIRGNATRAFQQKSFNLFARREYDEKDKFEYDFWGDGSYASEITLASGGNDVKTRARDYITSKLTTELSIISCKYRPCAVFLNGEYWGMYYLSEKVNAEYIHKYYDIPESQAIVIRNWQVEEGKAEDLSKLHEDMQFIGTADLTIPENYEEVCDLIDIESTIDYFAYQMCIARCGDWLGNPQEGGNVGVWKSATIVPNKPYYDGKWRWILFDSNSYSMTDANLDTIAYLEENCFYGVFANLMTNNEFKEQFVNKVEKMINSITEPEYVNNIIEQIKDEIRPQVLKTYVRYYDGIYTETTYEDKISSLESFFERRYDYLSDYVAKQKYTKGDKK